MASFVSIDILGRRQQLPLEDHDRLLPGQWHEEGVYRHWRRHYTEKLDRAAIDSEACRSIVMTDNNQAYSGGFYCTALETVCCLRCGVISPGK